MRQTWLYRCLGILAFYAGSVALSAAEPTPLPRALLKAGGVVPGRLLGTSAAKIAFVAADGSDPIPVAALSEVVFDAGLRRVSTAGPARRVVFQGGEQWHGDVLLKREGSLQMLRTNEQPANISISAVSGVYESAGELSVVYEDFESEAVAFRAEMESAGVSLDASRHRSGLRCLRVSPGVAACRLPIAEPVRAGRVELSFFDDGRIADGVELRIELEFRGDDGAFVVQIVPGWKKHCECVFPKRARSPLIRPLPRSAGWHDLTIAFDEHRLVALIDDELLARATGVFAGLENLRVSVSENPSGAAANPDSGNAGAPHFSIDDVKITRDVEPLREPESTTPQGAVWLAGGDEVFGDVLQLDAHQAVQHGTFGRREWPWKALRGVILPGHSVPQAPAVAGLIAAIDLAPLLYSAHEEPDRLVAAIESLDEREAVVAHPWLGKLHVPAAHLSRIVPQFVGTLYIVDPADHHLGNAIREDMKRKLPEASRWERQIVFDKAPVGKAWLSLLAADLEAAAPLAPRTAPFRAELLAGFLTTDLYLNGRRIDALNRHVALKAAPSNPQRLRIALPAGALRAGANTLRFEQRPARDDPHEFDDLEFSRVAIEIEPQHYGHRTLFESEIVLYHVSEQPGIERFVPRPAPQVERPVVWAVSGERLQNYLLPRDCPRVTYFAGIHTLPADVERFLGASHSVCAIETGWLERVRKARLYCYVLPAESFHCVDECAGYFRSFESVVPARVEIVEDLLYELTSRGVELRVQPSLWALHDAVIASTLNYSIIRMRNAAVRPCGAS